MATDEPTLSAEDYLLLLDEGHPTELVRGKIVAHTFPPPAHGFYCARLVAFLGNFLDQHPLGRVTAYSGIVTERNPDTVRGADVSFYSFTRLPRGPIPAGYLPFAPELVFEVLAPTDRWGTMLGKVAEFLNAGVVTVGVLDPETHTLTVYHADHPQRVLSADEELRLPQLLQDFRVLVGELLE